MCFEFMKMSDTQSARNSKKAGGTNNGGKRGFFRNILDSLRFRGKKMGAVLGLVNTQLTAFQKKKLMHEFHVFFDLNKDGKLEWKDFEMARQKVCEMSGWKPGTDKYIKTHELFMTVWRKLQDEGDENNDGLISTEEWLRMWQNFHQQCMKEANRDDEVPSDRKLPEWLENYIRYKFDLMDRAGDGILDCEEFEYVLSDFGVSAKDARTAFLMISQNNERRVDFEYYKELCTDYFRSDDPSALGNFITGKLDFGDK